MSTLYKWLSITFSRRHVLSSEPQVSRGFSRGLFKRRWDYAEERRAVSGRKNCESRHVRCEKTRRWNTTFALLPQEAERSLSYFLTGLHDIEITRARVLASASVTSRSEKDSRMIKNTHIHSQQCLRVISQCLSTNDLRLIREVTNLILDKFQRFYR